MQRGQRAQLIQSATEALHVAWGLNLKMRSSGNHLGRLSITKRGSPVVRHYLYLAALRLGL